jgi:topoisomerase-4 subunit A
VAEKMFVGPGVMHVGIYKKNDKRTIYNVVYRDGKAGYYYIKRFAVTGISRDREWDLTQGTPGSRILYFTANPNGEAEIIKLTLDPTSSKRKTSIFQEKNFADIMIKSRGAKGVLLSKKPINRIGLKSHGHSTLGGRMVWYDPDVNRLNYNEHGRLLGEFFDEDMILVVLDNGDFYTSTFEENNHYETNIKIIEKFDPEKVWSAVLYDADNQGYPYLKRFQMEQSKIKRNYLGDNRNSVPVLLTDQVYPRIKVTFGGNDAFRPAEEIDVEQFIGVKGYKAKGKRLSTWQIENIEELEPIRWPEPEEEDTDDNTEEEEENLDPDAGKSEQQVIDEITGQLNLFPDE